MKIEEQVCSVDLSKRLKELGVKNESLFVWISVIKTGFDFVKIRESIEPDSIDVGAFNYPAFTVAELGDILPKYVSLNEQDEKKAIFSNFKFVTSCSNIIEEEVPVLVWSINYICDTTNELRNWLFDPLLTKPIYDRNEANARAKMLIYLLEHKLMELPNE